MRPLLLAMLSFSLPTLAVAAPSPTEAICKRVENREPPAADRPTAAQSRSLAKCDSETLYYGEKGPADFARARLCAFREDEAGHGGSRTDAVFAGPTILMQIYANGLGGVKRDLDVATHYACAVDGAPAEIEGRLAHLQSLKARPEPKRFDYCDDITSGLAGGFCAARDAAVAKTARAARTAGIEAGVPVGARPALAALRKAAAAYVDAHGGEVDESGTARAQMVIDDEEATRDAFTHYLGDLAGGRWPPASPAQAAAADAALNRAYAKALAFLGSKDNFSTVKPEDCRKAQRAWIAYRDAFIAFARAAGSRVSAEAVTALLSQERAKDLTDLAG